MSFCDFCNKKLRKDNTIGACRQHRSSSISRKSYYVKYRNEKPEIVKKAKINHRKKAYARFKFRYNNDLNFKIAHNLRTRIGKVLKKNKKIGSALKDLGCTVSELRLHLESKFRDGMSWDNYGDWHIDHIKPLISFNLQSREEFLAAVNFKNLQPLWASENCKKGARIEYSHECPTPKLGENLS